MRHRNQRPNRQISRLILHRRNLWRAHLPSPLPPSTFNFRLSTLTTRAFHRFFQYPEPMQHVTISLPDELLAAFSAKGQDFSRAALEALAIEAYRTHKISAALLRQLLGFQTRMQLDAFLKEHGIELEYTLEDLERDRETHRQLGL